MVRGISSTILEGGRFTLEFNGDVLIEEGCDSVDRDIINITESELCPPVDEVYRWTNQGRNLLYELVDDECADRALQLSNAIYKPLNPN